MEIFRSSPFGKLKHKRFQILEALQFVGFMPEVTDWLHGLNKETRTFLSKYYLMIYRAYYSERTNILTLELNGKETFQSYLYF